jgi:hypothetical protein
MKKEIIISILVVVITVISIFSINYYSFNVHHDVIKNTVESKRSNDSGVAIMLETGSNTGIYEQSKESTWPTTGYEYNPYKSGCERGSKLTYDGEKNTISVSSGSSDRCFVYFSVNLVPRLYEKILANNGGVQSIVAKGKPDFAKNSITNDGMYATTDDYGTSYYFRGAVDNNWVKFAGFYWRIVRINGNNTVRLVYSGITAPTESQKVVMLGTGTQINGSTYAYNVGNGENVYVGYKFTSGDAHGLSLNSTAKTTLENWYNANLVGQDSKIADSIFCNDRTSYVGPINCITRSGDGVNGNAWFSAMHRLISESNWEASPTAAPVLTCPEKNDTFTVSDITKGNGALNNPISLLSIDEVAMAGDIVGGYNKNFYLYTNQKNWTISPELTYGGSSSVFYLTDAGNIDGNEVTSLFGLRPVISLKSSIETTGSGTWNDPYIVS